jgi:hypothetical protein
MKGLGVYAAVIALLVPNVGCVKSMLVNGQLSGARQLTGVAEAIGDLEVGRSAAGGGLVQLEALHALAPDNLDGLFMLTRSWAGYGFAFAEDDYEAAVDAGDDDLAELQKARARMAYDRAVSYGISLLKHRSEDFGTSYSNASAFRAWLGEHFGKHDDAEDLFWVGNAWLSRINIGKDDPALVADLFVGIELLERSRKLDPDYMGRSAQIALAAYHARSIMAAPELELSRQLFEEAIARTRRTNLMGLVIYATRYACVKQDRALYEKLLHEVIDANDPDPAQRMANAVAKRRAKRYLRRNRMMDCGFDMANPT